ncbi:MAG: hypothetical protein WB721_03485, partial [Pseudolabrys sp.]
AVGDRRMARKNRKLSVGKKKEKIEGPSKRKIKARKTPKRQSRNVADKVKSVYRTVVDTIKGTDQLRNKMEPPATSETE